MCYYIPIYDPALSARQEQAVPGYKHLQRGNPDHQTFQDLQMYRWIWPMIKETRDRFTTARACRVHSGMPLETSDDLQG